MSRKAPTRSGAHVESAAASTKKTVNEEKIFDKSVPAVVDRRISPRKKITNSQASASAHSTNAADKSDGKNESVLVEQSPSRLRNGPLMQGEEGTGQNTTGTVHADAFTENASEENTNGTVVSVDDPKEYLPEHTKTSGILTVPHLDEIGMKDRVMWEFDSKETQMISDINTGADVGMWTAIRHAVDMHCLGERLTYQSMSTISKSLTLLPLVNGFATLAELNKWRQESENITVAKTLEKAFLTRDLSRDACLHKFIVDCDCAYLFTKGKSRSPKIHDGRISDQMLTISQAYVEERKNCPGCNTDFAPALHTKCMHVKSVAGNTKAEIAEKLRALRTRHTQASLYLLDKALLFKV